MFSFSLNKQDNRAFYCCIVVEYRNLDGPSVCVLQAIPKA